MLRWQEEWLTLGWDYSLKERWWRGGKTRGAFVGRRRAMRLGSIHHRRKSPLPGGRCAVNKPCNALHSASLATSLITVKVAKERLVRQAGHEVISPVWVGSGNQIEIYDKATDSIRRLSLCRLSWSPAGRLTRAGASIVHNEGPLADPSTHFGARGLATDLSTRPRHSSQANIGRKAARCVAGTWKFSPVLNRTKCWMNAGWPGNLSHHQVSPAHDCRSG
jgi:hypothetical protein